MEALYERVLARVPTPQLHENYNGVLQEELEFVYQRLGGVLAAVEKLEEVREAVSKLQQSPGSSTSAHNDSLIALADSTMELQQKLRNQLNKLVVGIEVLQQEKKRQRVREPAAMASISTVDAGLKSCGDEKTRAGARCNRTVKKAKRLEADVDSYSDSGSSEKEEEAKLGTQKPERGESVAVKQKVAEACGLKSNSSSGSESDEREEDGSNEDADNVGGSEAAWKALKGRLPSEGESKLDHAMNTTEQREEGTSTTVKPANKSATYIETIVEEAEKIYPLKRLYIVPDLLAGLKEALEEDVDGLQQSAVASSLKVLVGWWTDNMHFQAQHAGLYREYVVVVESYLEKLPSSAQKFELKRQQEDLLSKINSADNVVSTAKKEKRAANAIKYGKKHMGMLSKIAGSLETSTSHEKHINRLLRMLLAFKLETAGDVDGAFSGRM